MKKRVRLVAGVEEVEMDYLNQKIGDIVADNFATSEVFSAYDIDFC